MTSRNYSNLQSPTRVLVKSGEVGNGPSSNNWYWRNDGFATGSTQATEVFVDYAWWPAEAENRVHNKLTEAIAGGGKAQLLTAAAEWKSSLEMVTSRTLWILDSYRSFRRFDIPAVVRKLQQPVVRPATRPRKGSRQTVTAGWLEYWMGWAPAMGDIYAALDVLQRPFPKQHVSMATGYEQKDYQDMNYPGWSEGSQQITRKGSVGVYADMEITNYNLYLMNQMGLLNPLSTGYQVIPFSFVLGWFMNVEQCLNALTDFAGVKLEKTGMAHYQTREGSRSVFLKEWVQGPDGNWRQQNRPDFGSYSGVSRLRMPGQLPKVQLVTKFDRLSLTRAATAVSLLVEIFLRKRD